MSYLRRLFIVFTCSFLFTSCGGGISSSGSGIGGTGITLVGGNVSSIDGEFFVSLSPQSSGPVDLVFSWIIPPGYAQANGISSLRVSGGGRSTEVDASGGFSLPDVTPNSNFVLTFTINNSEQIRLGIGQVDRGAVVTVRNIELDTRSNSAKPEKIEVKEPETVETKEVEDTREQEDLPEKETSDQQTGSTDESSTEDKNTTESESESESESEQATAEVEKTLDTETTQVEDSEVSSPEDDESDDGEAGEM